MYLNKRPYTLFAAAKLLDQRLTPRARQSERVWARGSLRNMTETAAAAKPNTAAQVCVLAITKRVLEQDL